jgi:hypothetical protein
MRATIALVLAGCAAAPEPAAPFDPTELRESVDRLRTSAAYRATVTGDGACVVERFRGGVLKVRRGGERFLRIASKAWRYDATTTSWSAATEPLWDPDALLSVVRAGAGRGRELAPETVDGRVLRVVEVPAADGAVRAWLGGGLRRIETATARVEIDAVQPSLKMEFDDVPAPWSEEMRAAAAEAAKEAQR